MPLFVITGYDVANSTAQRKESRAQHLARLNQLEAENRLIIAGPTPIAYKEDGSAEDIMTGSIIIADFENLSAVQTWINDEPYLKAGVYSHVDIKPFLHVLPNPNVST